MTRALLQFLHTATILVLTAAILLSANPCFAQGEVVLYSEDFENGPAGWHTINMQPSKGVFWHQTQAADQDGASIGVAWCGTDDPNFVNSPGYGNRWCQDLKKTFTLTEVDPSLTYRVQYDMEASYDYLYVEASFDGGLTFDLLRTLTGYNTTHNHYDVYSESLVGSVGDVVTIRFRFYSDIGFSDEDGLIGTNGGARLDWVTVGSGSADEFDSALDGWTAFEDLGWQGPWRLETGLGGNPGHAWTAHELDGPHAGQFPWSETGLPVHIGLESPLILIPPDAEHLYLEFDIYRDLPLANWVFYDFQVAAPIQSGAYFTDPFIYYAPPDPARWVTRRIDLMHAYAGTDANGDSTFVNLITPGAINMVLALTAEEHWPTAPPYWYFDGGTPPFSQVHAPGPWFDNVRVLLPATEGILAGVVQADCPAPDTPLYGVTLVAYDSMGAEAARAVTDDEGYFEMTLLGGTHTLSVVTPLGYSALPDEYSVDVLSGQTVEQDFELSCLDIDSNPRSIGYWKHQVSEAAGGAGQGKMHKIKAGKNDPDDSEGDIESPVCDYLDVVANHFNSNEINQVVVYAPPASDTCRDKISAVATLLNLHGNQEMVARAQQQLMALLLNSAAGYIHLTEIISEDGATVSQAITHCDLLIDTPNGDREAAKTIADLINNGQPVPAGMIPLGTDQIAYRQGLPSSGLRLASSPNPFNPMTTLRYYIPENASSVSLAIYDTRGRLVRELTGAAGARGWLETQWNGADNNGSRQPSGVYFAKLVVDGQQQILKLAMLK